MSKRNGTIPPPGNIGPRGEWSIKIAALAVGQNLATPKERRGLISALATYWGGKLGRKFVTRLQDGQVHVWRVS